MIAFCCSPPGARCDVGGGVLVSTERPRKRIASGWYASEHIIGAASRSY